MMTLALLLLSILPQPDGVLRDSVDLMELNHFYNEYGGLVFDQVIFYEWTGERFDVRAWWLVKAPHHIPAHDFATDAYVMRWLDGNCERLVASRLFRETWSQDDPELIERERLPKEKRRPLSECQAK